MNTWSGQPESAAWHWTDENRKKLGNVIYLLKSGGAKGREQAYQGFIELKRNFLEAEFDEYLNRLDDLRGSMGEPPLRKIMDEIRGERAPVTGWVAKEGAPVSPVMLPEMENTFTKTPERGKAGTLDSQRYKKPATCYDLLIKMLKGGYHALEM